MVKNMAKYASKKTPAKKMAKKDFTPCSRCPNPSSCKKAGMCLAEAMS